jgi:hypothetical protein
VRWGQHALKQSSRLNPSRRTCAVQLAQTDVLLLVLQSQAWLLQMCPAVPHQPSRQPVGACVHV